MSASSGPSSLTTTISVPSREGNAGPTVTATVTSNGGGGGGGPGGPNSDDGGGPGSGPNSNNALASSASLYLYTFLATLLLLLSISTAILVRSCILRRRNQRFFGDADDHGVGARTGRNRRSGRGRVNLKQKPVMWDVYVKSDHLSDDVKQRDGGQNFRDSSSPLWMWDGIRPLSAEYVLPDVGVTPAPKSKTIRDSIVSTTNETGVLAADTAEGRERENDPTSPSFPPPPATARSTTSTTSTTPRSPALTQLFSRTRHLTRLFLPHTGPWRHRHHSSDDDPVPLQPRRSADARFSSTSSDWDSRSVVPPLYQKKLRVAVLVSMPRPPRPHHLRANVTQNGDEHQPNDVKARVQDVEIPDVEFGVTEVDLA